jgi:2-oxoisovalerate dehydrogenase E1 component alpha subunit
VGAAFVLDCGKDWVVPYYRDLALMLALDYTPRDFILGFMGKKGEPTSGTRQTSSHLSLCKTNVFSHSSPIATQPPHTSGIGLAIKLRDEEQVFLTSIGEGSSSTGEWHEGVNWAAIHNLPVIFLVENNIYAFWIRKDPQMAVDQDADKAKGIGLLGESYRPINSNRSLPILQDYVELCSRVR